MHKNWKLNDTCDIQMSNQRKLEHASNEQNISWLITDKNRPDLMFPFFLSDIFNVLLNPNFSF